MTILFAISTVSSDLLFNIVCTAFNFHSARETRRDYQFIAALHGGVQFCPFFALCGFPHNFHNLDEAARIEYGCDIVIIELCMFTAICILMLCKMGPEEPSDHVKCLRAMYVTTSRILPFYATHYRGQKSYNEFSLAVCIRLKEVSRNEETNLFKIGFAVDPSCTGRSRSF
jgi:hypothetical protein